jgi:hypothetical protein
MINRVISNRDFSTNSDLPPDQNKYKTFIASKDAAIKGNV